MTEPLAQRVQQQAARWVILQQQPNFSATERQRLALWLAEHPQHRQAYQQALQLWQQAAALPTNPKLNLAPRKRKSLWPRALAVAAGVLLMVGWSWHQELLIRLQADQYSAQAIQQVHLADGSQVLLDAQSAISINYSPQRRQIKLLKGAATFYVEPSNAPFQVQTQQTEIQALGTVFMVRQTAQHTQVAALEHSVAVSLPKLGQQLQLDQGQSLQVAANGQQVSAIQPLASQHADWQQGYLVFNQQPLAEVVQRVASYCPYQLLLINGEKAKQQVSAVLQIDQLEQGLSELVNQFELQRYQLPGMTVLR